MCRDRKGGFRLIISCFLTNGAISAIDNIFQSLEEFCTETETSHSLLLQCSVGLFSFGGENVVLKDPLPSVGSTSHFKKFTSCTLNYFVGSVVHGMKINRLSYGFLLPFGSSFTNLNLFCIFLFHQLPAQF